MTQRTTPASNKTRERRRWLTPLPEKIVQKVFGEILRQAKPIDFIPSQLLTKGNRSLGAVRTSSEVRLYWLDDCRKCAESLALTFPKDVLARLGFFDAKSHWLFNGYSLLAALYSGEQVRAIVACCESEGQWQELILCAPRETSLVIHEQLLDVVPKDYKLFLANDLLSTLQLNVFGLPVVGFLGKWPLPLEKLSSREIAVGVTRSSSSGRPLSPMGSKLRRSGVKDFEEVDRGQLEINWILESAKEEMGALRPRFWQATLGKFLGSLRRGVLKLGIGTKECEPCEA